MVSSEVSGVDGSRVISGQRSINAPQGSVAAGVRRALHFLFLLRAEPDQKGTLGLCRKHTPPPLPFRAKSGLQIKHWPSWVPQPAYQICPACACARPAERAMDRIQGHAPHSITQLRKSVSKRPIPAKGIGRTETPHRSSHVPLCSQKQNENVKFFIQKLRMLEGLGVVQRWSMHRACLRPGVQAPVL